ncbi:hypothetical protein V8C86DRAFT_2673095 [Haematococcus lacustris]
MTDPSIYSEFPNHCRCDISTAYCNGLSPSCKWSYVNCTTNSASASVPSLAGLRGAAEVAAALPSRGTPDATAGRCTVTSTFLTTHWRGTRSSRCSEQNSRRGWPGTVGRLNTVSSGRYMRVARARWRGRPSAGSSAHRASRRTMRGAGSPSCGTNSAKSPSCSCTPCTATPEWNTRVGSCGSPGGGAMGDPVQDTSGQAAGAGGGG